MEKADKQVKYSMLSATEKKHDWHEGAVCVSCGVMGTNV